MRLIITKTKCVLKKPRERTMRFELRLKFNTINSVLHKPRFIHNLNFN